MTRRGEIVIECDTPTCHAEIVLPVSAALDGGDTPAYRFGIGVLLGAVDWHTNVKGEDICPQCFEEFNYAPPR
jgi:hypothetical protein